MFQKLREVFKKFIESASSLLTTKDKLVEVIEDLKLELISRDVAYEVAENITNRLLEAVEKGIIKSKKQLMLNLREIIISYFTSINRVDLYNLAVSNRPFKVVFLGVNGVGKTTTIAKVAVYFRDHGFKPLMIAADTFRAAAQEQLKVHSERVGIPVFLGKYGVDPASVAYDGVLFGLNRGYDVFLIDTAGRMHVDVDLVNELRKIIRVVKPHFKILVVDALTGNDSVEQAVFFNNNVGVDGVIITKVDAYEEGGVPLTLAYVLKKPILFIGTGQGYRDLKVFDYLEYVDKVIPLE
ncbi:MAG: signal recognition particle-docking protein FtsY [Desulfurococcaceae archaeon]|nr:signal recognition particle-docking protein FtsY [Desulfurococcaceae archaeon]